MGFLIISPLVIFFGTLMYYIGILFYAVYIWINKIIECFCYIWCCFSYLVFFILFTKDLEITMQCMHYLGVITIWLIYLYMMCYFVKNNWTFISFTLKNDTNIILLYIIIYIIFLTCITIFTYEYFHEYLIMMNNNNFDNTDFNNNNMANNDNTLFNNNRPPNYNNDYNEDITRERALYDSICEKLPKQSKCNDELNKKLNIYKYFPSADATLTHNEKTFIHSILGYDRHADYKIIPMKPGTIDGVDNETLVANTADRRKQVIPKSNIELLNDFMDSTPPRIKGYSGI